MQTLNLIKHTLSELSLSGAGSSVAKALKTNGAVVIPRFIAKKDCDNLASEFEGHLANPDVKVWRDEIGSDQRIFGINNLSENFDQLYRNQMILREHKNYVRSDVRSGFVMCNKVVSKRGNTGSGNGWHRDSPFTHQFKAIVYLTEVLEENGPFEYLPKTHLSGNIRECCRIMGIDSSTYRFTDVNIEKLLTSKYDKVTVTGEKGDLILVDTKIIHRGSPIITGERLAATNYYFKSNMPNQFSKFVN